MKKLNHSERQVILHLRESLAAISMLHGRTGLDHSAEARKIEETIDYILEGRHWDEPKPYKEALLDTFGINF